MTYLLAIVLGVAAGVFAGLFGVGGGVVIVPLLLLVAKWDMRSAPATSLAAIGGAQLAVSLPESTLRRLFAVLMLLTAGQIAWRARRRQP